MPRRASCVVLLAGGVLLGGCGLTTTSRDGQVGDTLSAGGLRVTLIKVARKVGTPRHDVTGLSTPSAGMRFFGTKVEACNDRRQAIKEYDFELELAGGERKHPRTPETVYSDDFAGVREGCERGWIVFEVPKGDAAKSLHFKYDDTGGGGPGGDTEKHARFHWDLGAT